MFVYIIIIIIIIRIDTCTLLMLTLTLKTRRGSFGGFIMDTDLFCEAFLYSVPLDPSSLL